MSANSFDLGCEEKEGLEFGVRGLECGVLGLESMTGNDGNQISQLLSLLNLNFSTEEHWICLSSQPHNGKSRYLNPF